ncbi:MAG: PTS system mannose/fructose/N-acetylgalactosamine-transporter subunit IIB [bacterium]
MSLQWLRIDDRLIHGQVVMAWCPHLHPDRLLLCNDRVAADDWEQKIYQVAAADYPLRICTVRETVDFLHRESTKTEKIFVVVESPRDVVALLRLGLEITQVNVGGMHIQAGKTEILPFLCVDDQDRECFRILKDHHVDLDGRELPCSAPIDIAQCLGL